MIQDKEVILFEDMFEKTKVVFYPECHAVVIANTRDDEKHNVIVLLPGEAQRLVNFINEILPYLLSID